MRDFDFLRDQLNLPIEYDPRRRSYSLTAPLPNLPFLQITEAELFAILVAERIIAQYRGNPLEHDLRSAFRKLAVSLGDHLTISLGDLNAAMSFRPVGVPRADARLFKFLTEAVVNRREIEFDYSGLNKPKSHRRVHPYHLACVEQQWYLLAHDTGLDAMRTFVPARMKQVKATGEKFVQPKQIPIKRLLRDSFAIFFDRTTSYKIRIRFDAFAAPLVRERKWHHSQRIRELAGGEIELTLRLNTLQDVERWILAWGNHATALEPVELRDRLRAIIRAMASQYSA